VAADPKRYSRLLVAAGLLPLLLADTTVGLPDGAFVGGSTLLLLVAAGVHARAGEFRAGAGWLVLAGSIGLFAVVDVTSNGLYLVAVVALLAAGFLLLASQRVSERSTE
jgi:hypothetical protein